ncbi:MULTISPECIES: FIST signal transduction protein [unclassified Mesorhizobium]|uniref:FIST signal transduction protein n=1 Tax=unclassified Mesorhizobium TaxID=325217 RepID=UPI001CCD2999|nr:MULTISPECIES: FIST signal transduction protein [unclassified Mesorhizobium]MBZ9732253.1 FIST signal transduction protein [Mesorhizobium sp. CA9]MBZ9823691.1 FIST signal transduction protein [Mesorhizobium sp. CA18]MBZ9829919.1 FIST signal transduction protein [Mesorhizobium sp. CA2]MBZ9835983.1 FIST signal transduction protein [Mesorhizobium sp. CA3]MBZ9875333.1 FIST signal transduction protein [Mesorhizobium sp. Ca11]
MRRRRLASSSTRYASGLSALTTDEPDPNVFARAIAAEAAIVDAGFALLFFSQSLVDAAALAQALKVHAPSLAYAGCSTAGEITPQGLEEGHALALLLPSASFSTVATMVENLSSSGMDRITGEVASLRRLLRGRVGQDRAKNIFALCFIDGLSYAEEAVTSAIHWGLDDIPLIGGSAGDDLKFETTRLIANGTVASDSAIVVLVATEIPFHVFKTDNFIPTDEKLVVTASDPDHRVVREFNATNAAEEYAASVGIVPQTLTPLSFASHPVVVKVGGEYYCRSIQRMHPDGSLSFFCAIDDGVVLSIAQPKNMVEATRTALQDVEHRLGGIDMILGFDCVLRRLDARNRQVFRDISELYRTNKVIGFGTYGEQYRSMHLNQTFTGIAFGERQAAE